MLFLILSAPPAGAEGYNIRKYSPLTLKIELDKDAYEVGEPIDGKIIINNTMGSRFPVVFNIKLYHDKDLFGEYKTSFERVFFGRTDYTFHDFGIPEFNDSPAAEGEWNVSILQQDLDVSNARWATIHIIPNQRDKENDQRSGY